MSHTKQFAQIQFLRDKPSILSEKNPPNEFFRQKLYKTRIMATILDALCQAVSEENIIVHGLIVCLNALSD